MFLRTFHRWGDLVFIAHVPIGCGKDFFPLDGIFSAFIVIGLIRDNGGEVIVNFPSSLIGEIWFDLQDKLL